MTTTKTEVGHLLTEGEWEALRYQTPDAVYASRAEARRPPWRLAGAQGPAGVSVLWDLPQRGRGSGMSTTTIAPVTVAELHAGVGACNLASVESPGAWQARACELLVEKHGPELTAAIVARIVALTALLAQGPHPGAYTRHEAHNVTPALFAVAATCGLGPDGRFDQQQLERLCGAAESEAA